MSKSKSEDLGLWKEFRRRGNPELGSKYFQLEGPEHLYYVCLSVRPSVCHTCGQRGSRSGRATKNEVRSHVLFTSSIFMHSSVFILNRHLSILNNTQSSEDSEDYILFFQYFIFLDYHFLFFFLLCCHCFFFHELS